MQAAKTQTIDRREVDSLLSQLHELLAIHRAELGEQGVDHELEWLTEWIEQFRRSDGSAKKQIDDHALKMLVSIRDTLSQATTEELRMQDESPIASAASEQHTTALRDTRRDMGSVLAAFTKNRNTRTKKAV